MLEPLARGVWEGDESVEEDIASLSSRRGISLIYILSPHPFLPILDYCRCRDCPPGKLDIHSFIVHCPEGGRIAIVLKHKPRIFAGSGSKTLI